MQSNFFNPHFGAKLRFLAVLLSVTMLLGMMPVEAFAANGTSYKLTVSWPDDEDGVKTYPSGAKKADEKSYAKDDVIKLEITDGTGSPDRTGNNKRYYYIWKEWTVQTTALDIEYTENEDGSLTIVMPAAAVKVVPTWDRKEYHTITYQWGGSAPTPYPNLPTGIDQEYLAKKEGFKEGSTVPIDATPYDDIIVQEGTKSTIYHFEGWSTTDASVNDNSFIMPDHDVTLTGTWSSKSVYDITYQWEPGKEGPAEIKLEALPPRSVDTDKNQIKLPDFREFSNATDDEFNLDISFDNGIVDYTFEGWNIAGDSHTYKAGEEYTVTSNTVITGSWSKKYNPAPISRNLAFGENIADSKIAAITASLLSGVPEKIEPGKKVYLPYLKNKSLIPEHPGYMFGGWTVTNSSTGDPIPLTEESNSYSLFMSRSAENKSYSFIMPESEVTIAALVLRETYCWEVQEEDTLLATEDTRLATITRGNVPFDQPKSGSVNLEIYVVDPTSESHEVLKKATQEFFFNYSGNSGFASVDLNIKPENGYHIYKVDYTACYGKSGPIDNGWKKDKDADYFTMDNVTDKTCAKIYLTKLTVEYHFEVDGQNADADASKYLDDYPKAETFDLFPFNGTATVKACKQSGDYHNDCQANYTTTKDTATLAFTAKYPHTRITKFTVPAVKLKPDIAEEYTLDNNGRWKGANEGSVEQGDFDLTTANADLMAGLISSTDPYVIPLTISISSKTPADVSYKTEHYLEQLDGSYVVHTASTVTAQATPGSTVTASSETFEHYTENKSHTDRVDSGTVKESPALTLKLYYDLDTHSVTFNSGEHGTFPGTGSPVSSDHKYGSSFPKVPSPKPDEGYDFDGWYDASNNKVNKFPDNITEDLTYTAHWAKIPEKPDSSDVTYKTEHYLEQPDGSYELHIGSTETAQAKPGASVTASPKKYDHYTENTRHEGRVATGTVSASSELTLKLYYDLDTHSVTFDSGDYGTFLGIGSSVSSDHKYGSSFPKVPSPKPEEGYQFDGWYDASNNKVNKFPDSIIGNLTYTAHWTKIPEKTDASDVTYKTEHYLEQPDGSYKLGSTETAQAKPGLSVTASPKKYDHHTENTRHEGRVASGTVTASPELTLKLYYDLDTHRVTFNSGDHGTLPETGSLDSSEHKYGSRFPTVPSPTPEEGYQFDGWYDASGNRVNTFPVAIYENLTYTARWTVIDDDDDDDNDDDDEEPAPSPAAITIRSPKTGENPLLWGSSAGVIISAAGFAFLLILKRKG